MDERGIPRGWWRLFCVELPIVAGTLAYWLIDPDAFLTGSMGVTDPGPPERYLLTMYAGVVGSLVFWFYARLLLTRPIDLRTFRLFQEALLLGDGLIVGATLWLSGDVDVQPAMATAQMGMASFWGAVRAVFLARVR